MWSVGCILAEILTGNPLFPGTSTLNQLHRILEITGNPSKDDIISIKSDFADNMLQNMPKIKAKSFKQIFPNAHSM